MSFGSCLDTIISRHRIEHHLRFPSCWRQLAMSYTMHHFKTAQRYGNEGGIYCPQNKHTIEYTLSTHTIHKGIFVCPVHIGTTLTIDNEDRVRGRTAQRYAELEDINLDIKLCRLCCFIFSWQCNLGFGKYSNRLYLIHNNSVFNVVVFVVDLLTE